MARLKWEGLSALHLMFKIKWAKQGTICDDVKELGNQR